MSAPFFNLELDTTGPQGVQALIDAAANYATTRQVNLAVTTTDPDTTGYQVKVWGDVDPAADPNIQATEAASSWITLTPAVAVTLSTGDGTKSLTARLRDDVWNESGSATDAINLDTTAPVVTRTAGPDVDTVSKIPGKDTATVTWSADSDYDTFEVRVVPSSNSDHTTGSVIPSAAGSANVSGGAGAAGTPVTTTIKGTDLQAASNPDGVKIVKVFVRDLAGNWSV